MFSFVAFLCAKEKQRDDLRKVDIVFFAGKKRKLYLYPKKIITI
jgi:hypothetical protein